MFGKFFSSTFTGSMIGAGAPAFAVWGYVISNARDGEVELNPRLLSAIIGESQTVIKDAIAFLCHEDEESRTKDESGKRLVHESGYLYRVVNHVKYRSILNEDDRKNYFRVKKRESRLRRKMELSKRGNGTHSAMSLTVKGSKHEQAVSQ